MPDETEFGTFKTEFRSANFVLTNGKELEGYVIDSGHAVGLFHSRDKIWPINLHMLKLYAYRINNLKKDIGLKKKEKLLPIEVEIPFKNLKFTFGKDEDNAFLKQLPSNIPFNLFISKIESFFRWR